MLGYDDLVMTEKIVVMVSYIIMMALVPIGC